MATFPKDDRGDGEANNFEADYVSDDTDVDPNWQPEKPKKPKGMNKCKLSVNSATR